MMTESIDDSSPLGTTALSIIYRTKASEIGTEIVLHHEVGRGWLVRYVIQHTDKPKDYSTYRSNIQISYDYQNAIKKPISET